MENVSYVIDSNIWCYYFDASSKEHDKVSKFINNLLDKNIVLNSIIIMELSHFLIKSLGPVIGKNKIEQFFNFSFDIEYLDHERLVESIKILSEYSHTGIGGRDATILATMKHKKIKNLVTHDKAFKKINFINVIDPAV